MAKIKALFGLRLPTILTVGALAVVIALAALVWRSNHTASPAPAASTSTQSKAEPPSAAANNSPTNAAQTTPPPTVGNSPQAPSSSNAAPSSTDAVAAANLPAPTGQILNKGEADHNGYISLNSTDPAHSPDMNSTCNSVSGATCAIIAYTDPANPIVVGAPVQVDSTYYSAQFNWSAKAAGLQPGLWWVRAVAQLGGSRSFSAAYQLDVRP